MPKAENNLICKNIFKNGTTTSKDTYTRTWVKLISQLEKNRCCTHQAPIVHDSTHLPGRGHANG